MKKSKILLIAIQAVAAMLVSSLALYALFKPPKRKPNPFSVQQMSIASNKVVLRIETSCDGSNWSADMDVPITIIGTSPVRFETNIPMWGVRYIRIPTPKPAR